MSAPGDPCVRCGEPLLDEGNKIRCSKCGFRAYKDGAIIDPGGRIRPRTLICPLCGGMASEDQFEEFKPKKAEEVTQ